LHISPRQSGRKENTEEEEEEVIERVNKTAKQKQNKYFCKFNLNFAIFKF
jgi:hypothetical protein